MHPGYHRPTGPSTVVPPQGFNAGNPALARSSRVPRHRRLAWIVLVLIGLTGAPTLAAAGPIIVESEDTGGGPAIGPHLTANQRVAARLFDEVFVQQKPDVCVLLMAANAVNHTPAGDFAGPSGFEQYAATVWSAYSGATFAIDHGVADGNLLTLHWTISGQQAGSAGQLEGLAILRFEQNMIAESWIQYGAEAQADRVDVNVAPEPCPPCREP